MEEFFDVKQWMQVSGEFDELKNGKVRKVFMRRVNEVWDFYENLQRMVCLLNTFSLSDF